MPTERDPYNEGYEASLAGKPFSANPYSEGGDRPYDISDWIIGWEDAADRDLMTDEG